MKLKLNFDDLESSENIVELIKSKDSTGQLLSKIGELVVEGYTVDEDSRSEWRDNIKEVMELIKVDVNERKTTPWDGASNIKYPLIKEAAIDYASRTLPEIIQNDRIVKSAVVGSDPDGQKHYSAVNVEKYMTYQLLRDDTDWEDGLDKLLQILPVLGTVFKKTYYNKLDKRNCSELCVPDKIAVNYNTQTLETARRITHVLVMYENDIVERQRMGIYDEDITIESLTKGVNTESLSGKTNTEDARDCDAPLTVLEQHFWYDLDGDGYKEPYIAIVHLESRQVLRIVNRFKDVIRNKDKKIMKILPIQYFTDFHFIKSSDGGFYSEGWGSILMPINAAINTLYNQLIDSGRQNNLQSGFLSRALRLKNGDASFKPGEWKILESSLGTDLSKMIYPLPTKEPSRTLYQLLVSLIQAGKDLAQSNGAVQGSETPQNVSNGVMNTLVDQGTKVYSAINKRVIRSLTKEFQKLYELNAVYVNQKHYREVLDDENADYKTDFNLKNCNIYPVADPLVSSTNQRLMKAQIVNSFRTADPRAIDIYTARSIQLDESEIKNILPQPDPNAPPPPEAQLIMSETQLNQARTQLTAMQAMAMTRDGEIETQNLAIKAQDSMTRAKYAQAQIAKMGGDKVHGDIKLSIAAGKLQNEINKGQMNAAHTQDMDNKQFELEAIGEANKKRKIELDAQLRAADITAKVAIADKKDKKPDDSNKE